MKKLITPLFLLMVMQGIGQVSNHPEMSFMRRIESIDSLIFDAQYVNALSSITSTLEAFPQHRISLDAKAAEILIRMGKLQEADNILQKLLGQPLSVQEYCAVYTQTGLLYMNQGRNDKALQALENALASIEKTTSTASLEHAQVLSYLGQIYNASGKAEQAEENLSISLAYRRKLLPENHELIAASFNDLGLVYMNTDRDKALDYYEKAEAIYKQLHGEVHPKVALSSINIGIAYYYLELYGDAVNNFEKALRIWEKTYPNAHPSKAFALLNLGKTYEKIGDPQAAIGYYNHALQMYKSSYGDKHPEIAEVYNAVGNLKLSENQFDEALEFYQRGIIANTRTFKDSVIQHNPRVDDHYHGLRLLYSMVSKAEALEKRYLGKSLYFKDLELALSTLQRCDTLIDKLRQQTTSQNDKLALGAIANDVYANGVRIALEAANNALSRKKYRSISFYFAEKSKSAVLLEAISDSNAKSYAGLPNALLEEEKELRSAIALTSHRLAQKPSREEEQYLRETLFNLNKAYRDFIGDLEKKFPSYYNLKYNIASPTIDEIQQRLADDQAMVSYFIDEKNRRLYIFSVRANRVAIDEKSLPEKFDKYITGLRNGILFHEPNSFTLSAQILGKLLMPSVQRQTKRLIIIPTGRLSTVPFEALLYKKPGSADVDGMAYYIRRFDFSYQFSAGLWLQKHEKGDQKQQPSIFLCAPVSFSTTPGLADLPGSEDEVTGISKLFSENHLTASVALRTAASESSIKQAPLREHRYIHFATHGLVDESNPELSRIYLTHTSDAEDGTLYTPEIYNLELNADLVTLSACQTGLGKITKGEGVIGLSRALVYAGAKNIIVSFWSVADESTSLLMKQFYQNLLEEKSASYAPGLRKAKLSLLSNTRYSLPFYWAPFILIGE